MALLTLDILSKPGPRVLPNVELRVRRRGLTHSRVATLAPMTWLDAPDEARERRIRDAVAALQILDTPRERAFDDLVALASQLTRCPFASIAIIDDDRYWFKAATERFDRDAIDRSVSFCELATQRDAVVAVADLVTDPLTSDVAERCPFPLRGYLSVPVHAPDGTAIAALSVGDTDVRVFSAEQASSSDPVTDVSVTACTRASVASSRSRTSRLLSCTSSSSWTNQPS